MQGTTGEPHKPLPAGNIGVFQKQTCAFNLDKIYFLSIML